LKRLFEPHESVVILPNDGLWNGLAETDLLASLSSGRVVMAE